MFKYIVKRILISLVVLLGVSVIIYFMVRLIPNNYIMQKFSSQLMSGAVSQESIDIYLKLYGLDDNSFLGICKGYIGWLGNMLRGNLGVSFIYRKPCLLYTSPSPRD